MKLEEALKFLEAEGRIYTTLSPYDNAVKALVTVLSSCDDSLVKASVVFALNVFTSEFPPSSVPSNLRICKRSEYTDASENDPDSIQDTEVLEWLVSNFTPFKKPAEGRRRSLRCVAQTVRFTIKMQSIFSQRRSSEVNDSETMYEKRVAAALAEADAWHWDVWTLKDVDNGKPLQVMGMFIFSEWDLFNSLDLDKELFANWLFFVQSLYPDNEYHNATHAADVLQAVHYLLKHCGAAEYLPTIAIFSVLAAAIMHDAGHDGRSNLFHQNTQSDRALSANDRSIQESYHLATVFTAMARDARIDILRALPPEQAREARRLIILTILGTDMKGHFDCVQDLRGLAAAAAAAAEPVAPFVAGEYLKALDPKSQDRSCPPLIIK
jgi:hypothetical protein